MPRWLQRTEQDRLYLVNRGGARGIKIALFLVFLGAFVAAFAPVLIGKTLYWKTLKPEFAIPRDFHWRVLYSDDTNACPSIGLAKPGCPALPGSKLWTEGLPRFPDEAHKARLKPLVGRPFWLGIILQPEFLQRAADAGAHHLMLSHFWSRYEVWINGSHVSDGAGIGDPTPAILPLSIDEMKSGKPIYVAVRAWHDGEYPAPDHLCEDLPPSLLTQETASGYVTQNLFWERVRPFTLMLSYALIAILFFLFWLPAPARQEYSYLALFAVSSAAYQARWTDFFYSAFSRNSNLLIDLFVNSYAAGFAMLLGLAFARIRILAFRILVPFVVFLPIVLTMVSNTVEGRYELRNWLYLWFEPAAFLIGGLGCLVQAFYLHRKKKGALPHRVPRLTLFGLGMIGGAVFYFLLKRGYFTGSHRHFSNGFEHLVLMLYFATLALLEYGVHQALVNRSPVSEYHRRPKLPKRIEGVLLSMDLKQSEPFYRHSSMVPDAQDMVGIWRSHVSAAAVRHGGTIVLRQGDEIAVFFEEGKGRAPALHLAVQAIEASAAVSVALTEEHRDQPDFPPGAEGFYFRAAICEGALQPIWEQTTEKHREPGWKGVGEVNPFLECSRLMEMEKKLPPARIRCVIHEELANRLARWRNPIAEKIEKIKTPVPDKHGVLRRLACYIPRAGSVVEKAPKQQRARAA